MPQIATALVNRGRALILGAAALLLAVSTAGAMTSPAACDEQARRLQTARELEQRRLWEEATNVASRVEFLSSCWLHYVRAQALLGWVLGHHLERLDEAIASYRRGLRVDRRQSRLWYELGFLLYRQNEYARAMEALEYALVHVQTTPPAQPEHFMMLCRLLYAESADRMAMLYFGSKPERVERAVLQRAVSSWHDYEDFCAEYGRCEPQDLALAAQRLSVLRKQLRAVR
jgi:tetratricopeptide (TPR) repeat protein